MSAALPIDARNVPAARRLLRTALDGHQPSTFEDAILMIWGLATNAVRHTHDVLLVLITIHQQTLHVDNPTLPVAPDSENNATSG